MTIPSVARMAHYVDDSPRCCAAIVVDVHQYREEVDTRIDLCVLNPPSVTYRFGVHQDELPPPDKIVPGERTVHRPGTWHWPITCTIRSERGVRHEYEPDPQGSGNCTCGQPVNDLWHT